MILSERIKKLVEYSELSIPKFAEFVGFKTSQAVREMLKGNTKTLSEAAVYKITKAYPRINRDWLVTGEGDMLLSEKEASVSRQIGEVPFVPLLSLDARGGFGSNTEDAEYQSALIPWHGAREGDFAMEVSGMSMLPLIPPGSYVLLRKVDDWRAFLEAGALYVLELADGRRLLKVVSQRTKDSFTLHSYNPSNPDQEIAQEEVCNIFKAVAYLAKLGF